MKEYRIKSTGLGAEMYGTCERCGKHCTEHFMQQSREVGQINKGWTSAGFGHVACLQTGSWKDAEVVGTTGEKT